MGTSTFYFVRKTVSLVVVILVQMLCSFVHYSVEGTYNAYK